MDNRRYGLGLGMLLAGLIAWTPGARGQDQDRKPPARRTSSETQTAGKIQKDIEDRAKGLGPWDTQQQTLSEATDNVFRQQGWDSEPDLWARDVLRDVEQIPPWQYQQREEMFMGRVQTRYGLTEHQTQQVGQDMRRESLKVSMKHFRRIAPIAMEIMRVRSEGKAFTAEMVQRWSKQLDPVIADAKAALLNVAERLESTMSPAQREQLKADLDATLNRHNDVVAMVQKWKKGEWDPRDWGLQNDPPHGEQMTAIRRRDDERNARVDDQEATQPSDSWAERMKESTWQKYVRLFCIHYHCDEDQVNRANAILRSQEVKAENIRAARKDRIEKLEWALGRAESDARKSEIQSDLDRMLSPIGRLFDELRKRLDRILTSRQRALARRTGKAGGG